MPRHDRQTTDNAPAPQLQSENANVQAELIARSRELAAERERAEAREDAPQSTQDTPQEAHAGDAAYAVVAAAVAIADGEAMSREPMPKLILVCGTSFAGKSTVACRLADRFGYPEVDVDATKADLFGDGVADEALDRADWEQIYRETDRRIRDHLAAGRSVIDASRYFRASERDAARVLCRAHGADLVSVHVDTPAHIPRLRLQANRRSGARRDVRDEDFAAILAAWEPPTVDEHPLVFHFGDDIEEWMERHAVAIADA